MLNASSQLSSPIATLTINPALDASSRVASVCPDRKLRCSEPAYEPGGGGINVARAIHSLGGTAHAIWTSGGVVGQLVAQLLERECVANHPVIIQEMTRENLTVTDDSNGCQYRFCHPGPTLTATEEGNLIDKIGAIDPFPDDFVISGGPTPGLPGSFWPRLFNVIPTTTRITVDTSGLRLGTESNRPVYLYKSNLGELGRLVDRQITSDASIIDATRGLISEGLAENVVTSLGAGGVMLVSATESHSVSAPTVPIVSRVGAGDSMTAGLVLALSQGNSIEQSLLYGVAAGTAAVMTAGSQLCGRADTEELFERLQDYSQD